MHDARVLSNNLDGPQRHRVGHTTIEAPYRHGEGEPRLELEGTEGIVRERHVAFVTIESRSPTSRLQGIDRGAGHHNRFSARNTTQWVTSGGKWQGVDALGNYESIDVHYRCENRRSVNEVVIRPGTNPRHGDGSLLFSTYRNRCIIIRLFTVDGRQLGPVYNGEIPAGVHPISATGWRADGSTLRAVSISTQ